MWGCTIVQLNLNGAPFIPEDWFMDRPYFMPVFNI